MERRELNGTTRSQQPASAAIEVATDVEHLQAIRHKLTYTRIVLRRAMAAYARSRELLARLEDKTIGSQNSL